MFYEIVIAPSYTPEGLEVLKGKSKALRILEAKPRPPSGRSLRQVQAGWLLQVRGVSLSSCLGSFGWGLGS
jgi:phosphoribosylaminoimidazolecarboxamide formyltransferase/IMP cyclohydrolase